MAEQPRILETQFLQLLSEVLRVSPDFREVEVEPNLSPAGRPDILAIDNRGIRTVIELKMLAPETFHRVEQAATQLHRYAQALPGSSRDVALVLAIPSGVIIPERRAEIVNRGILVWDHDQLVEMIRNTPDAYLTDSASATKAIYLNRPGGVREPEVGERLSAELRNLSCGRTNWSRYQRLCSDILSFIFCPPLEPPLYESATATGINRRDIILANYATDGFWQFLYNAYRAEFIVVEAKNYCGGVGKTQVLQLANYLSEAGVGLLGLIFTRQSEDRGALITRREQWITHRKMVIVMSDNDLHQMIENKAAGLLAEEVLRQKIQDFRLAI